MRVDELRGGLDARAMRDADVEAEELPDARVHYGEPCDAPEFRGDLGHDDAAAFIPDKLAAGVCAPVEAGRGGVPWERFGGAKP